MGLYQLYFPKSSRKLFTLSGEPDYFPDAAQIVDRLILIEPADAIYRRQIFGTSLNEGAARLNSGESDAVLQIRQKLLENAQKEAAAEDFQKAVTLWQNEESAPDKLGLSEDLTASTQKEIAECEAKAALWQFLSIV